MPQHVQRRAVVVAEVADRRLRPAVLHEQLVERQLVEAVEADAERLVLVVERVEVRRVEEGRELPPRLAGEEVDLALLEAERAENLRVGQLLLGAQLAVDEAQDVLTTRVRQGGEAQLLHVAVEDLVARLREVLRAPVDVQAVGERVAERAHVAAGVAGGLEHGHVVASLHQLVRAREPGDAAAGDDHALRPSGRGTDGLGLGLGDGGRVPGARWSGHHRRRGRRCGDLQCVTARHAVSFLRHGHLVRGLGVADRRAMRDGWSTAAGVRS